MYPNAAEAGFINREVIGSRIIADKILVQYVRNGTLAESFQVTLYTFHKLYRYELILFLLHTKLTIMV